MVWLHNPVPLNLDVVMWLSLVNDNSSKYTQMLSFGCMEAQTQSLCQPGSLSKGDMEQSLHQPLMDK